MWFGGGLFRVEQRFFLFFSSGSECPLIVSIKRWRPSKLTQLSKGKLSTHGLRGCGNEGSEGGGAGNEAVFLISPF